MAKFTDACGLRVAGFVLVNLSHHESYNAFSERNCEYYDSGLNGSLYESHRSVSSSSCTVRLTCQGPHGIMIEHLSGYLLRRACGG
jgi:hypothetical protein